MRGFQRILALLGILCINKSGVGGFQAQTVTRTTAIRCDAQPKSDVEARLTKLVQDPRALPFSISMASAGAVLGPFLDSYHSLSGVLTYDQPITRVLWGTTDFPALVTTDWVPPLFAVAGWLIGWLYIIGDSLERRKVDPSVPLILVGISVFTFQYWSSGLLFANGIDRVSILNTMSVLAALGYASLDRSKTGFWVSTATALGGPLIEVGLLSLSRMDLLFDRGYHYNDLGETGFFPLWIIPVYFLGGPAVGNLARGVWKALKTEGVKPGCPACNDTRCVPCPNCDGRGIYTAMGGRSVPCTSLPESRICHLSHLLRRLRRRSFGYRSDS